jgi:hypothetical protein
MHETTLRHAIGRSRRPAILAVFALVVATALFAAPRAHAVSPILDSVDLPLYENHPTFHWRLPTGDKGVAQSVSIETATNSDVGTKYYDDGHFLQQNLTSYSTLGATATSFTDLHEYRPGTYFVHVAGYDPDFKCTGTPGHEVCRTIVFSNVLSFTVVAPPLGGGGGGGGGGGADKVAPLQTLSFKAVQDVDKLFVIARSSERATVKATGTVSAPGAAKVYRFKSVKRSVAANAKTKLRLKLGKKQLRAVKRRLKGRRSLKAKIVVSSTDKAGNTRRHKLTIRLVN